MRLVYLIGQPAAGKSTLMAAVTEGLEPTSVDGTVPHVEWHDPHDASAVAGGRLALVTLGRPRARFPGTDTLSMAIQPKAIAWLTGHPYPLVAGEGDRLASVAFFDALRAAGVELEVLWLDTPDEVAAERRAARGSAQNDVWVRGRQTKVRRLAEAAERLDGTRPVGELAGEVRVRLGLDVSGVAG